jgi:isopenicillin N synthase-like dioxygenase
MEKLISERRAKMPLKTQSLVDEIMPDFLKLLEEDENTRERWKVNLPGEVKTDRGLWRPSQAHSDKKSIFHYRPHLPEQLLSNRAKLDRYQSFLNNCQKLYDVTYRHALQIISQLDEDLRGQNLVDRFFECDEEDRHLIRIVAYDPHQHRQVGGYHPDRSFLTQHLAESAPGLQFRMDFPQVYPTTPDTAVVFFGYKAQLLDDKVFEALVHGARTEPSQDIRWAVIAFTHIEVGVTEADLIKEVTGTILWHKENPPTEPED